MNIVLLRCSHRALLLPAGRSLLDCSHSVRYWLGTPVSETVTELRPDTPMPGIPPQLVLGEILRNGFCALDLYGVVRAFSPVTPPPDMPAEIARDVDTSAGDLLRSVAASCENPRG